MSEWMWRRWSRHVEKGEGGDVPGWVLIVLMTSALVVAIWGIAKGRLVQLVQSALDTVCGGIGC
jgi:hypothetical protein